MRTGVREGHSSGLTKPPSGSVGGELGARFGRVSAVGVEGDVGQRRVGRGGAQPRFGRVVEGRV
jgi:hypothetical protein